MEYGQWNTAILRHCLLADAPVDGVVYLTVTPRTLAGAFAESSGTILAAEQAESQFVNAVSAMYESHVLPSAARLKILRRCGQDGLPECAALLAASVLAAYRMHTDEGAAANAYYMRFDELLRCGIQGGLPRGFDPEEFEGLWLFLRAWLGREHHRRLAMPGSDVGKRFVALPLTHVPLRQVDIERLPEFFAWAGYEAGARLPTARLDADLVKWTTARCAFTNSGMNALGDERRGAVLSQVASELECWDGSHTDAQGRRSAHVEVFLEWERRLPKLSYLPRRPAAFPATFDDGTRVLDAGQDGWYEPVPIGAEDGGALRSGFSWESLSQSVRMELHRSGAEIIAFAPSEFAGPLSHNGLVLHASGAVLCRETHTESVRAYIEGISGGRCSPVQSPNVPTGWRLFTGVKPVRRLPPPAGLESLEVVSTVEIIPRGGLRLGRRWAWIAEAPPTILALGVDVGERVLLDGEPVSMDDEGAIRDEGRLARPGIHIVEVGRIRRRIEIVEPVLPAASSGDSASESDRRGRVTALPRGDWKVLGACPSHAPAVGSGGSAEGVLVRCAFDPVWAVSCGSGPGAVVLCLAAPPPAPSQLARGSGSASLRRMRAWADAVYHANIRHPHIRTAFDGPIDAEIAAAWRQYAEQARAIKRRLRAQYR